MSETPAGMPAASGEAGRRARLLAAYALAVLLPLATLAIRMQLPVSFGERPLLLMFVPAIVVSSLLGGLGSGLLATAVAGASTALFLIPPVGRPLDAAGHDIVLWGILVANGVLVSAMSEFMHRAWRGERARWRQIADMRDALRQSEARFEVTFEQAAVGIAQVAPDGHWLRVNGKLCEILGYHPAELLAMSFQDITHPDDLDADLSQVRRMLAREIASYAIEKRYIRKDGGIVWANLTVALAWRRDGTPDYFISVVEDIRARKAAEEAVREGAENLRKAQRQAGLGNWRWDLRTGEQTWSEEMYRLYGRDPALPPAEYPEVQTYFTPESWANLAAAIDQGLAEGMPYECDAELQRPDGTRRWVIARGEAIRDARGKVAILHGTVQDIDARKQAEARLRLWSESFEHAHFGLAIADARSDALLAVNPAFADARGYLQAELAGRPLLSLFPADIQGGVRRRLGELGVTTNTLFESEHLRRDGGRFPVLLDITVICDDSGEPVNRIVYALDITARKQAEQALARLQADAMEEQRRARLAALNLMEDAIAARERAEQAAEALRETERHLVMAQEGAHVGVWDWNLESGETYWSPEFDRLYGVAPGRVHGHEEWLSRVHPDDLPRIEAEWQRNIASGRPFEVEYRVCRSDGEVRWMVSSGTAQLDAAGKPVRLSGISLDITRRKETELQLHKLAQAIEQNFASVLITDLDGRIEYVNAAFVRNSGYCREELIGRNPRLLQSGGTPPATYDALWAALREGRPWQGEFRNRRKDGSEYIDSALIAPLRQPDGTLTHYVAVQADVTETRYMSEELDAHRHHLEEPVAQRTAELEEARTASEAASRAKSAFLANMSHEIRTPMNVILGLSHLLLRDGATPAQSERLEKIDGAARYLLTIINDILDLSKIEAGKFALEERDFALSGVLDHVRSLIGDTASEKGLRVHVDGGHVPLWLRGDLTRLRQCLLNFAGNAVKFTPAGDITLRAGLLEDRGERLLVRFEVEDSGIGIAADVLPKLFQAFEQGDATTTRRYGGTGLGLAITRRLAQAMGGDAGVLSEPGRGSTFWFSAWLGRGHAVADRDRVVEQVEVELRRLHAGARVLVADDNPVNCEVALELLHGLGLEVDIAGDGRVALEKVRSDAFDLVLMDVQMPLLDGIAATRAIRALPGREDLPVIAMTASAFEEDRRNCEQAGMNDFVPKPVEPQALFATLLKWLPLRSSEHVVRMPAETALPSSTVDATLARLAQLPGMDVVRGVAMLRGKKDKYVSLMRKFAASHADDMARLIEHLARREHGDALRIAHTLKGLGATMGAVSLGAAAAALEALLREEAPEADDHRVRELADEVGRSLASIVAVLADGAVAPTHAAADTPLAGA